MRNDESNDEKTIAFSIDEQGNVVPMHELIWESMAGKIPPGYMVSHKNGDGLDNRDANLCLIPDLNGDRDRLLKACARARTRAAASDNRAQRRAAARRKLRALRIGSIFGRCIRTFDLQLSQVRERIVMPVRPAVLCRPHCSALRGYWLASPAKPDARESISSAISVLRSRLKLFTMRRAQIEPWSNTSPALVKAKTGSAWTLLPRFA
jgi:HNH endonuclease